MPAANKFWFRFLNSGRGHTIEILDDIGGWGMTAKEFANEFKRIGKTENVHLYINSNGGNITDGNEIINILKRHKGEIEVSIGAYAASMATAVAMQGDMIRMAANGIFVIHNPFVMTFGDSEEHRKMADVMDKLKAVLVADYVAQTGLSTEEVSAMMDEETWMDAEEALAKGFIDEIGEEAEEPAAVTAFAPATFKNAIKFFDSHKPAPESAPATSGNAPVPPLPKKPAASKPLAFQPQNSLTMELTAEQIAAQKAAQEKAINDGIKAKLDALATRDKEIKATVDLIANRDKRDVTEIAGRIIEDRDKTHADFLNAVMSSPEFKPAKNKEVIGSGIEVVNEEGPRNARTIGAMIVNSREWQAARGTSKRALECRIPDATNFRNATLLTTTTTGFTPTLTPSAPILIGVQEAHVADLLSQGVTNLGAIPYWQEDSFTNAATSVAEEGLKPEASWDLSQQSAPVVKIAVIGRVSDEVFDDMPSMESYVNARLRYSVEIKEDYQILQGAGGSDLTGIIATSGVQTQALGGDTKPDAVRKGMTKIQSTGFFQPDGIVFHPNDWEQICLLKDTAGQYLGGGPFYAPYGNGQYVSFERFWGLNVVVTTSCPEGTAVVGAWKLGAMLWRRKGLTLSTTDSDGEDFRYNRLAIRAEERVALQVGRPKAFCLITGI